MIYHDMPEKIYRDAAGLSQSIAKLYKIPAVAHAYERGEIKIESSAFRPGTLTHKAVLEPLKFAELVSVMPEMMPDSKGVLKPATRQLSSVKEWEARQEEAGKIVVNSEERDQICRTASAVHSHPQAHLIFTGGKAEVSIFGTLEGVHCKGRVDWLPDTGASLVDLKTVESAAPEKFSWSIFEYGYHIQAAFYLDLFEAAGGEKKEHFVFICVEKKAPYLVACYCLDSETLEIGRREYKRLLSVYQECHLTGIFPGYSELVEFIGLPETIKRKALK